MQGERPMANDCVSLGMFNLSGIPPAPRGVPQIEVTFDIDANGIMNVAAKDLATQKEAKITITANNKLSKDEIEKLKRDSEQFAEADKKKKDEAEVRNEADNLIYAAEKLVKQDLKDKVKPDFTVQPEWREELYRRYRAKGIEVDRKLFEGATRSIDRELDLRITRIAFGDSTARRRSLDDDPQLSKALELLRRGNTQAELFALVTAKR